MYFPAIKITHCTYYVKITFKYNQIVNIFFTFTAFFCYNMPMKITSPETIEEHIISHLQHGPVQTTNLISSIKESRPKTTKQGVYLILRKLKRQEIIFKHKGLVGLSNVWLSAMEDFFSKALHFSKQPGPGQNDFLILREGEKLQYYFNNPISTDTFWSHTFLSLVEVSPTNLPVLIYNPHEWFILFRTDNEVGLFKKIIDRGQKLNVLVGNNTKLDKLARKYFPEKCKYKTLDKQIFKKDNYYVNVVGNFVIEAWIDPKINGEIDKLYLEYTPGDKSVRENFEKIISQKSKNKFTISHSKRKADKIRAKFKKYFLDY